MINSNSILIIQIIQHAKNLWNYDVAKEPKKVQYIWDAISLGRGERIEKTNKYNMTKVYPNPR